MKRFWILALFAAVFLVMMMAGTTFATTTGTDQGTAITGTMVYGPTASIAIANNGIENAETTAQVQAKSDQQANDKMISVNKYDAARQRISAKAEDRMIARPLISPAIWKTRTTPVYLNAVFCSISGADVMRLPLTSSC